MEEYTHTHTHTHTHNTSKFYGLPIIRKPQLIIDDIKEQNSKVVNINELQDLKVKPIVEGPKCPTRNLTELIPILLKPFLKYVKSYIRENIDFSNKCDRNTDENAAIATINVFSVCTFLEWS